MRIPQIPKVSGLAAATLLVVAGFGVCPAGAAPKPALVPPPGTWQLEIQLHGDPEQISVVLPGETQPRRFWYLLYTLTNNTGRDVDYYPQIDLFTDTFKTYPSGVKARRAVFEAIRRRYDRTIPLLETESQVTGRILQGEDNARDTVAIFEDFDPNATKVQIFLAGLTNETVRVKYPAESNPADQAADRQNSPQDTPQEALLRKTLVLEYQVTGDRYDLDKRVLLYRGRRWIMR